MKRFISFAIAALAVSLCLTGCWDAGQEKQQQFDSDVFSADSSFIFDAIGRNEATFSFQARDKWGFSRIPSGYTVEVDNRKVTEGESISMNMRGATVKVTVDEANLNESDDKKGELLFGYADDSYSGYSFAVSQEAVKFSLKVDGQQFTGPQKDVDYDWYDKTENSMSTPTKIAVSSNVGWELVRIGGDEGKWLDLSECSFNSGRRDSSINVIPLTYNTSGKDKGCIYALRVLDKNGDVLAQETTRYEYKFNFSQGNIFISAEGDDIVDNRLSFDAYLPEKQEKRFSVVSTDSIGWSIGDHPGWTVVESEEGDVKVTVQRSNPSTAEPGDDGVIGIDVTVEQLQEPIRNAVTVNVRQLPFIFNVGGGAAGGVLSFSNGYGEWNEERTVNVETYGEWGYSGLPEWIDLVDKGPGFIKLRPNTQNLDQNSSRNAALRFYSNVVDIDKNVSASQPKFNFGVNLDDSGGNIGVTSTDKHSLTVKSSGQWKASSSASWLVISDTGVHSGDGSITYNAVSGNDSDFDRTATITVTSVTHQEQGSSVTKPVSVTQEAFKFSVDDSGFTGAFDAVGGESQTMTVKSNVTWDVTSDSQWITLNKDSSTGVVKVSVGGNSGESERSGNVTITSQKVGSRQMQKTFRVKQKGYEWKVTSLKSTAFSYKGEEREFNVTCSGNWEVTLDSDAGSWLTVSPASWTGNQKVTVTCARFVSETAESQRQGEIVVKSKDFPDKEESMTVKQNPYQFAVSPKTNLVFDKKGNIISGGSGTSAEYTVSCTGGNWDVDQSDSASGITASIAGNKLTIQASKNTGKKTRSNIFTIYSKDLGKTDASSVKITVTQNN